jgi:hypothetical protein
MFNINQDGLDVYYPGEDIIFINNIEHKVPKHVRGKYPFLTITDGEVWVNGYVYDIENKIWHSGPYRTIIKMVVILIFAFFMCALYF